MVFRMILLGAPPLMLALLSCNPDTIPTTPTPINPGTPSGFRSDWEVVAESASQYSVQAKITVFDLRGIAMPDLDLQLSAAVGEINRGAHCTLPDGVPVELSDPFPRTGPDGIAETVLTIPGAQEATVLGLSANDANGGCFQFTVFR